MNIGIGAGTRHHILAARSVVSVLLVVAAACAFGIIASLVINWASGKSPLWNIGFGVVIVLAGAALLLTAIVLLLRRFSI